MAYYSSSFYEDDHGDYTASEYYYSYSTPFYNSYEPALVQDSVTYSSYNFNDYQSLNCDPAPYSSPTCKIAYSASVFGQPDHIYLDPDTYYSAKTHFIVSYSVSDFEEPEFDEYDPTPYDGGYDITATYGKPLPPSDEICYPRSTPDPNAFSSNGVPSGLITAALGNENVHENAADPSRESPQVSADDAKKQPSEYDNGNNGNTLEKHGEYGTGYTNGSSGDQDDYVSGKRVPQIPSGYALKQWTSVKAYLVIGLVSFEMAEQQMRVEKLQIIIMEVIMGIHGKILLIISLEARIPMVKKGILGVIMGMLFMAIKGIMRSSQYTN